MLHSKCPQCLNKTISYQKKLRLLADEYALECSQCGASIGIHWSLKLAIGFLIFFSSPFSFGYLAGQLGFLVGVAFVFIVPIILFLILALICPLVRKSRKNNQVSSLK